MLYNMVLRQFPTMPSRDIFVFLGTDSQSWYPGFDLMYRICTTTADLDGGHVRLLLLGRKKMLRDVGLSHLCITLLGSVFISSIFNQLLHGSLGHGFYLRDCSLSDRLSRKFGSFHLLLVGKPTIYAGVSWYIEWGILEMTNFFSVDCRAAVLGCDQYG